MRKLVRGFLVVAGIFVVSGGLVRPVHADGVVGNGAAMSCTEYALATALSGGGTITFACGGAATIILTAQKTISVDTTLDGGNLITLSGGNATRFFLVNDATTLTLNNITLRNGYTPFDGGAIFNAGSLVLTHTTIQDSQTEPPSNGGAIVTYGALTITDSTLIRNHAGNGGALYVHGGVTTIRNSILRENGTTNTTNGWGGAMLLGEGVSVDIEGGEIANNTGRYGGGIHNRFATSSLTLHGGTNVHDNSAVNSGGGLYNIVGITALTNVTLQNNAGDHSGGGLFNSSGTVTLTNVLLQSNSTAQGNGGGISNSGTATLTNVTLQGNSATLNGYNGGGGMNNIAGTATLTNVTFQGNSTAGYYGGGGLYNGYGSATLTNVTLQGNSAANSPGGGISNFSDPTTHLYLKNVVIADSGASGNCFDQAPDSPSFSLSTDTSCTLSGVGNRTNTPAVLGGLQDNGGGLLTLLPQPPSPLIDQGQCLPDVLADERGVLRPQGSGCDIGAVEVQPSDQQRPVYLPFVVR